MASPTVLPEVPVKHADFISHVSSHPTTPLSELLEPYKQYDAKLREVFAQEPTHSALSDPHLNIVPVFSGNEKDVKIRARDLDNETAEEKEKYVMSLKDWERLPSGTAAIVDNLPDFQQNFSLFSEASLVDLDWSNVVAAGSSVVTSLLPVPEKYKKSKRALRQYYHEILAPASDVDLFLYGLSEEDAVKKIVEIEKRIKDSILTETTTIRTKNAITIASQYPTRHVQIVLRIYKSVSEILTGFDVDCSCAAYDGKQVWAAPRALTAYMSQINTIDLTRRSPSYENRLSKYSHRGFEVYWPLLERSRIDPTIFERNFARTVGLARLLVLERLPSKTERDAYRDERRRERGRPAVNGYHYFPSRDNIKEKYEDEVAEWVDQEDVSDYHTFTIPYGEKYYAKKIEKLLYTKDLLLNAEWNKKEDREVNLHRHPAFFGHAEDVIHDCCGFCPKPVTPEEHDAAEEKAKVYVSGEISFIKDDAGRQAIGSFHPITDDDWTEMAYVGNTARLCQAIIDRDLEHVEDWLSQEGADPNCRDYTGRTPLHLAVVSSSPEIVRALIDHGARLVARLADGRTALHLVAARGNVVMLKLIMQKSEQNEEEEAEKEEARKRARMTERGSKNETKPVNPDGDDSDLEVVETNDESDDEVQSTTTGSFVKVKADEKKANSDLIPEEDEDDPDVYDVNVVAWDTKASPLHLAILNGHVEVVKELVQNFGADVLLPVKLLNDHDKSPRGAILTLVLSLNLPLEQAKLMTKTLLELGASSAQADTKQTTALHYISGQQPELLETLFEVDEPAAKRAINHLAVSGSYYSPSAESPLMSAICKGNALAALQLLDYGAAPNIEFKDWMKSVETQYEVQVSSRQSEQNKTEFEENTEQPIILAVQNELPGVASRLLEMGADPNTFPRQTRQALSRSWRHDPLESLLDIARKKITDLRNYKDSEKPNEPDLRVKEGVDYLAGINEGSYTYFVTNIRLIDAQKSDETDLKNYEHRLKVYNERKGIAEKKEALEVMAKEFEKLEKILVGKGGKTFEELHPDAHDKLAGHNAHNTWNYGYNPAPKKPFEVEYGFNVHNLTDEMREAYVKLFQAVWENDLNTVKALTLASWGSNNNAPLKIAVSDTERNNPFSIAVLRGHLDLARALVDISYAQYQPPKEEKPKRYRLANEDEDDASDTSEVGVFEEIVDDKFTIDNIGEVQTQVKSTTTPLHFISMDASVWEYAKMFLADKEYTYGLYDRKVENYGTRSLQSWAILTNNKPLFSFLLDLDVEWADRLAIGLDGSSGIPSFSASDFELAIKYGRIEILAEMIKHGGAGMELESLVKKSGVKYREKPKYYQGLSVHGKKRSDWVSAARGEYVRGVSDSSPPLLQAAFNGALTSVEWFFSDTPLRHYLDFAEAYKDDKFISHLNKNAGGYEKVLRKWLGARRELALHCAVMATPGEETTKLIKYLLRAMPGSLEVKSIDGLTPLSLAISLRRLDAAKLLIEAGADQTVRNNNGRNILHLLLCSAYTMSPISDEKVLQPFLDLIDKRLVTSLLTERCSLDPGSLTPIAFWLHQSSQDIDVLRTLLEFAAFTNNAHLELLDGAGDTPLHWIVKSRHQSWVELILEFRPDLLFRENSVGRTPFELAEDAYTYECVSYAPNVTGNHTQRSLVDQAAETFVKDYKQPATVDKESVWRVCRHWVAKADGNQKRRIVSLIEANEVAKRLADRREGTLAGNSGRRYGGCPRRRARDEEGYNAESDAGSEDGDAQEDVKDEVRQWYHSAVVEVNPLWR
ncbi:ankyrin [Byssothecium circinans]|uniref:Ankyrin n=1 Tax=Byssothecium circinans TaxID=147558 RepID=A0A6A5TLQ8_9PLEO|nr:ankyrin [Byssothecium circinans]